MFLHADTIVKAVMIAKSIELLGARRAVRRGLRALAGNRTGVSLNLEQQLTETMGMLKSS
jgi:hypothetical protein